MSKRQPTESARACAAALTIAHFWLVENDIDAEIELSEGTGLVQRRRILPMLEKALAMYREEHGAGSAMDALSRAVH